MINNDTDIVAALRRALAEQMGPERFGMWFAAGAQLALANGQLRVTVQTPFYQEWLRTRFRAQIEAACSQVLGRIVPIVFEVDPALVVVAESEGEKVLRAVRESPDNAVHGALQGAVRESPDPAPGAVRGSPDPAPTIAVRGASNSAPARRRLGSFESLVVGACNRLAYVSAQGVAEQPGSVSPLVIHGATGTGKTHLLEGIWTAARRAHPKLQAVYLSAEQFTTTFLDALHGSGLPAFRRKYRGVQLLLVDDLQFFSGKRATLIELLSTVDTLLREGRQLVFAADRAPAELTGLGAELRTRLQGGLVCGLESPDFETRLGIAAQMARDLGLSFPDEALRYIAAQFRNHARELAGALKRLHAVSLALRQPVTLELAQQYLAEMIRQQTRMVRLPDIERAVCHVFGLEPQSLQSGAKARDVSHPRMLAMWLARKHTRAALSEIGQYFGGRRHSTVISAQKKVDHWIGRQQPLHLADGSAPTEEVLRRLEDSLLQLAG